MAGDYSVHVYSPTAPPPLSHYIRVHYIPMHHVYYVAKTVWGIPSPYQRRSSYYLQKIIVSVQRLLLYYTVSVRYGVYFILG